MTDQTIPAATLDLAGALAAKVIEEAESSAGARILGIAGGPGSGKSTLAAALAAAIGQRRPDLAPAVVPMDGFHLAQAELLAMENQFSIAASPAPGSVGPPGRLFNAVCKNEDEEVEK